MSHFAKTTLWPNGENIIHGLRPWICWAPSSAPSSSTTFSSGPSISSPHQTPGGTSRLGPSNAKRFWGYFWMGKASENDCDGRFWAALGLGNIEVCWKKHEKLVPPPSISPWDHRSIAIAVWKVWVPLCSVEWSAKAWVCFTLKRLTG